MNDVLLMTPGPTEVHEEVRKALSQKFLTPDIDQSIFDFYRNTCCKIKELLKTKNDVLILCGEGILGLEAACASLIEPGDKVLCLDNGIFGRGFANFAQIYGADVQILEFDYRKDIDAEVLEKFLKKNNNFKLATLVHCETPSGITNKVDIICPILKKHGILTVVDSVSAIGGEQLLADEWCMDVVLGASQKCLSAPPGLTFMSISQEAWRIINNRKSPIKSFYCNISNWQSWYEKKWFPYTQPANDIAGFETAVQRIVSEKHNIERHSKLADLVRKTISISGLCLYPLQGFSNTVSTVYIPQGINFDELYGELLYNHKVMIGSNFGFLKDITFRIGHMGENCREEKLYVLFKSLDAALRKFGAKIKEPMHKIYTDLC